MSFEEFKLNRQLLNAIEEAGFKEPSPIQQKAIPLILAGHDVLGIAQTGTGKTAAFVLPILMKVKYAQGKNPRVLILTPTRELAMQIDKVITQLSAYTDIRSIVVYGGTGMKAQIEAIEKGIDIITATPGRFMDLYLQNALVVKEIKTMVLDEADKMMDMGFMPQIRRILEVIPTKRQNLLFSATMPEKVLKLSEEFLEFPLTAEVTPESTPAETVEQILYEVPNFKTKINLLEWLLKDETLNRVIVFVKSKETANNIFKFLSRRIKGEIKVIHANKGQNTRINAMEAFKQGDVRVLVATDVASRGIDVAQVSHVINFDIPLIYQDYVHRIGRTGRANNTGKAVSFAIESDKIHIEAIEKIIRQKIPVEPIPQGVVIEETSFEEKQRIAKEIDDQRKKADPTFKGAFHEKKDEKKAEKKNPKRRKKKF